MKSLLITFVVAALAAETVYGLSCYTCVHIGDGSKANSIANETELFNSCKWGEDHNSTNVQECTNEHKVCGKLYFHANYYDPTIQVAWRGCIDSRPPWGTPEPNSCQEGYFSLFPLQDLTIEYRYCNCDTDECNTG